MKISVVVTNFNYGKWLRRCIRSLLNQIPTSYMQNCNPICKILLEWMKSLFDFNASTKRTVPLQDKLKLLHEEIGNQKAIVETIFNKMNNLDIKLKVNNETYSKKCLLSRNY